MGGMGVFLVVVGAPALIYLVLEFFIFRHERKKEKAKRKSILGMSPETLPDGWELKPRGRGWLLYHDGMAIRECGKEGDSPSDILDNARHVAWGRFYADVKAKEMSKFFNNPSGALSNDKETLEALETSKSQSVTSQILALYNKSKELGESVSECHINPKAYATLLEECGVIEPSEELGYIYGLQLVISPTADPLILK